MYVVGEDVGDVARMVGGWTLVVWNAGCCGEMLDVFGRVCPYLTSGAFGEGP